MHGVDVSHVGIEDDIGKGDRCRVEGAQEGASRSWLGWGFFTTRMMFLIAAYSAMYAWRLGKNGECVTVYKVLGDPEISAWDVAGTVAPGVSASMFELVCLFKFCLWMGGCQSNICIYMYESITLYIFKYRLVTPGLASTNSTCRW